MITVTMILVCANILLTLAADYCSAVRDKKIQDQLQRIEDQL